MGTLKPIGSEKLKGSDKLARIIEIARYKESIPNQEKNLQTESYSVQLADGNTYRILHEKNGYVIQKTINESFDYIEPMKNRKYYSSYSDAFKRINLIAKELNTLHENREGVSLFGEQKKFVLKTPTPPPAPEESVPEVAPEIATSSSEITGTELPTTDNSSLDIATPSPDLGEPNTAGDSPMEAGEVSFKQIQKLTGKLAQKLREFKVSGEMSSKDIKYVINSILSALDLKTLEEDDKEEILSRFDSEDLDTDMEIDTTNIEDNLDISSPEEEVPMGEGWDVEENYEEIEEAPESKFTKEIMDSIFSESKVESLLTKYFEKTKSEILSEQKKHSQIKENLKNKIKQELVEIKNLSESVNQEKNAKAFLRKNPNFKFIGKTNKKSLVFENKNEQIRITKEGEVI